MNLTIEDRVRRLEERIAAIELRLGRTTSSEAKRRTPSPREFLLAKSPQSDNDKTLVAGYYVEVVAGKDSFDFDDVAAFLSQAKEAAPKNRRDPPYQNVRKGYFREVGKREKGMRARNRWALTNSGIKRVEDGLGSG